MTKEKFEITANPNGTTFAICEVGTGAVVRDSTTTDTITLFNAVNGVSKSVKDVLGVPMMITDIVITSADISDDINDPDGVKHSKPCVHFFGADGEHVSSVSNGICRATDKLLGCGLVPTPENPIKLMFTTVNTKKGTAHTFTLLK